MSWSVVEFSRSQYIVCESASTVKIRVERYGAINATAAVDIRAKEMSAKQGEDYVPSSTDVLKFDPGLF